MPTYNVKDNPYYDQWRGNNLISDLLANATQSFSAPQTGPYGERKGFFRSLIGDQTNRMNSAAAMRQQDVDAGAVPFQKEVAQEDVINKANNEGAASRQAAGEAARMQVAKFEQEQENKRAETRQNSAERQANIADQWQNQTRHDQMENDRILRQAATEQQLRKQANLQGERGAIMREQMQKPYTSNDFLVDPKAGTMTRTRAARYGQAGDEVSTGQEQMLTPDKLKWLEQGDSDEATASPLPSYQPPVDIDSLLKGSQFNPSLRY
jgi:hypothetical protein